MYKRQVDGEWITVKADAYAKSVEIQNENEDLILSDNYFDMNGGEKKVRILDGEPKQITLRSVYAVSYTHLDVYKRQGLDSASVSSD